MRQHRIVFIAVLVACSAQAQTQSERDIKKRLIESQKALDAGAQDRLQLTKKLADSHEQAEAAEVKRKADAELAQKSASSMLNQNASLFIVQLFALLALIIGVAERLWTSRKNRQWELENRNWQEGSDKHGKELSASVKQVHTLVNSNLTAALENELDARANNLLSLKANLVLLQALGKDSTKEGDAIKAMIARVSIKISELTRTLAERASQTRSAEQQLQVDLKHIENDTHPEPAAPIPLPLPVIIVEDQTKPPK